MIPQLGRTAAARRRAAGGGGGGGTAVFRSASGLQGDGTSSLSVPKPAGVASGDILLGFAVGDDMAPTTLTGFTEINSGTATGLTGAKVFQKTAGGSEPASYTAGFGGNVDVAAGVLAVSAASATLAAAPVAATGSGTSMAAPSVTGVAGGLLVCAWFVRADASARAVTAPASMAKRIDPSGTWATVAVATESLTAAGATGTRTATFPISTGWRAVSLVVAGA